VIRKTNPLLIQIFVALVRVIDHTRPLGMKFHNDDGDDDEEDVDLDDMTNQADSKGNAHSRNSGYKYDDDDMKIIDGIEDLSIDHQDPKSRGDQRLRDENVSRNQGDPNDFRRTGSESIMHASHKSTGRRNPLTMRDSNGSKNCSREGSGRWNSGNTSREGSDRIHAGGSRESSIKRNSRHNC
jgi:hypothetical protein